MPARPSIRAPCVRSALREIMECRYMRVDRMFLLDLRDRSNVQWAHALEHSSKPVRELRQWRCESEGGANQAQLTAPRRVSWKRMMLAAAAGSYLDVRSTPPATFLFVRIPCIELNPRNGWTTRSVVRLTFDVMRNEVK